MIRNRIINIIIVIVVMFFSYKSYEMQDCDKISDILLSEIEALSIPEYDYAIIKCKKSGCTEFTGVCISVTVNGTHGVKCDYSSEKNKDCCGVEMVTGSV